MKASAWDIGDLRRGYCAKVATYLEAKRGIVNAVPLVMSHYRLMAQRLGEGKTPDESGDEILKLETARKAVAS